MVTDADFEPSTVSDHRKRVRSLIEAKVSGGYHPLTFASIRERTRLR